VPLKILLADDSMTAQKMGKEILIGAGYEVIAVSNGAAAAKKLAEKPDICVLDIIMPGYTGIEVCEKIRANMETAKTPVLLTVGKMEHYEQKDAQRVAADGVIVKPFEATDLIAAVQKLADQLAPKAAAAAAAVSNEKTIAFTPPSVEEWKSESEVHDDITGEVPASKKSIEVPSEVAAAPAFMDFGHSEPEAATAPTLSGTSRSETVLGTSPNFASMTAAAPAPVLAPTIEFTPMAPVEAAASAPPAFDLSATPSFEMTPAAPVHTPQLTEVESAHFAALLSPSKPSEPAASAAPAAEVHPIEFTAQPPVEVSVPMVSGFEATAHESVEVGQAQDSALVTGPEGFDSFKTTIGRSEPAPAAKSEEDDFEARVAAAMAQLEEPVAEVAHGAGSEDAPVVESTPERVDEVSPEPDYLQTQRITLPPEFMDAPPSEAITKETPVPVVAAPVEEATPVVDTPVVGSVPTSDRTGDTQIMRAVPDGMMDAALVEQKQTAADVPVEPPSTEDTQEIPAPIVEAVSTTASVEAAHQEVELAKALVAAGADAAASTVEDAHPEEVHEIAHTVRGVFERMLPDFMEEVKKELAKRKKQ
jgi:CheY-like chemotaxis protein